MIARWDRFWFAEVDGRSLAAMRITLGLLTIAWLVGLWPDLHLLAASGPIDTRVLDESWTPYRSHLLDGFDVPELRIGFVVLLAILVAWTAGLGTPVTGALVLIALAAIWHRSPWIQNGGDRLLRIWWLTMVLTPCGRVWSVDAWRRGTPSSATVPIYGHRLVQLQLLVMYVYTGIAKLEGATWLEGTAIYYALSNGGYGRWPALFDLVLAWPAVRVVCAGLTWVTLVWECLFAPLVMWRRTRAATLLLGVALHGGIFGLLSVGIFSWSTLWGYLAWLDPGWAARVVARVRRPAVARADEPERIELAG